MMPDLLQMEALWVLRSWGCCWARLVCGQLLWLRLWDQICSGRAAVQQLLDAPGAQAFSFACLQQLLRRAQADSQRCTTTTCMA